jgi:hypothetical protein
MNENDEFIEKLQIETVFDILLSTYQPHVVNISANHEILKTIAVC